MMIGSFKDLKVYQKSYSLVVRIYGLASTYPGEEKYGMVSQMKRAAMGIPLCIAEGYAKRSAQLEFRRYLLMSVGSEKEMQVLLDLSLDLKFIRIEGHTELYGAYDEVARLLNGLIRACSK